MLRVTALEQAASFTCASSSLGYSKQDILVVSLKRSVLNRDIFWQFGKPLEPNKTFFILVTCCVYRHRFKVEFLGMWPMLNDDIFVLNHILAFLRFSLSKLKENHFLRDDQKGLIYNHINCGREITLHFCSILGSVI